MPYPQKNYQSNTRVAPPSIEEADDTDMNEQTSRPKNDQKAEYGVSHRVYKPRPDGGGAASRLEYKRFDKGNFYDIEIFWTAAPQVGNDDNGNAKFDWENRQKHVNLKLGPVDISKLILLFEGKTTEVKLFHVPGGRKSGGDSDPTGDNTSLKLYYKDKTDKYPASYSLEMGSKRNGAVAQVRHSISLDEAVIILSWLRHVLEKHWEKPAYKPRA